MLNKWYRWFGYFNDALYHCILWFFISGICTMQLFIPSFSYPYFFVLLLWYIFVVFGCRKKQWIVLCSIILGVISFYSFEWYVWVLGILYYFLGSVWFGMMADKKIYLKDEVKMILLVLIYATIVSLFSIDTSRYASISSFGLFFLLASVIYMIRTNVIMEYEHNTSTTIQKERNIIFVNVVAIVASVFCFFIRNHIIDFLMILLLFVFYAIYFFVKVMIQLCLWGAQIVFYICSFLPFHISYQPPSADENPLQVVDDFLEATREGSLPQSGNWWNWIFVIIGIGLIFYFAYRMYHKFTMTKGNEDTSEEREFVLDAINWTVPLQKKWKKMQAKHQLSAVRKQYIEAVNACIREQYPWKESFTPNEYLRSVDQKSVVEKYHLQQLTEAYNQERYGGEWNENSNERPDE
ncbi:MAG: DUF4129 domain-containing protein [Erysipelotrichaceae bacterium]|nr:DUF4129 domain-containing protein [Erysipelotrichaceae bacterium]